MKHVVHSFLLGGLSACALLAGPWLFASAPIDLSSIELLPLVTEAAPDPTPPPTVEADFRKRFQAVKKAFREKKPEEGASGAEAILKDFAAYPALVREMRTAGAFAMMADKTYEGLACRYLEALIAEKGRPTSETTLSLWRLRNIHQNFGRYDLANQVMARLLAQPDVAAKDRFPLAMQIVRNDERRPGNEKRAVEFCRALLRDGRWTNDERAEAALRAGTLAQGPLRDAGLALAIYEEALRLGPLGSANRAELTRRAVVLLSRGKKAPRLADGLKLAREFYQDESHPARERSGVLSQTISSSIAGHAGEKELESLLSDGRAFLEKHGKELDDLGYSDLHGKIVKLYDAYGKDAAATSGWCERIVSDPRCNPSARLIAADHLVPARWQAGDYEGVERLYRSILPGFSSYKDPKTMAKVLSVISDSYYARDDLTNALSVFQEAYRYVHTPGMTNLVVQAVGKVYERSYLFPEAVGHYVAHNALDEAIALCSSASYEDDVTATRLSRRLLPDEKAPLKFRKRAYEYLYGRDRESDKRYLGVFLAGGPAETNAALHFLATRFCIGNRSDGFYGDYRALADTYETYARISASIGSPLAFPAIKYATRAYLHLGEEEKAIGVCRQALAGKASSLKPIETYYAEVLPELLAAGRDAKSLTQAIAEADRRHAGTLAPRERIEALEMLGSSVNHGDHEALVRALQSYVTSLYAPFPKKRYVVPFTDRIIMSARDMEALPEARNPARLDRHYGGNMDFLLTDVGTGDRGGGIGEGGDGGGSVPTMVVLCDVNGIHFRFEAFDDRARDIENRLIGGGSYECYIAPGENQPEICFMSKLQTGSLNFWNTTYDAEGHKRIENEDSGLYRSQTYFTEKSIVTYVMLSWDAYANLIPSDGTIWEFENILWGRNGDFAWNGTESIHGRSTWGELAFRLPESARVEILRRQLFRAKFNYNEEKLTRHVREGILDFWKDDRIGDPAFYDACVRPLVEKLDGYAAQVKNGMTDETVLELADEALPLWTNLRFIIARLRADYLSDKLAE